jgi:hypothetical protein
MHTVTRNLRLLAFVSHVTPTFWSVTGLGEEPVQDPFAMTLAADRYAKMMLKL